MTQRLYLATFFLKHNEETTSNTLRIVAPDLAAAYAHAELRRNSLRYGSVHKDLIVRDITLLEENLEIAGDKTWNDPDAH